MTELLQELVKVPHLVPIITVITLVGCIIFSLFANNYDKNHDGKNPYLLAIIILICLDVAFLIGMKIRYEIVKSNIYDYVTIKKENNHIIIKSHSTFVESKTFKIKETVNDINIVEYEGKEFVVRNQQLQ